MIAAIWLGMAMYLVRPVQAESASNSFASWLDTVVKKGDIGSDDLRKQLYNLKESNGSLNTLIQKASEIVSRHNEDFDLPLNTSDADSEVVYDLLIWEWNSYQTGNGMGKASIPATLKSNFYPTVDKFAPSLSVNISKQDKKFSLVQISEYHVSTQSGPLFHVIPLSGGTAIGAP